MTCRVAPHHFHSIPQFAAEAFRVLRPGGRLLIADTTVPDDAPDVDAWQNRVELLRDRSHMRNCSPSEWRAMAEQAGFIVERVDTCPEANAITLKAWLTKAGCEGEAASEVEELFANAPAGARQAFDIQVQPGGDIHFNWLRVVLCASKPA